MIASYTKYTPRSPNTERSRWISYYALIVFIYEGILKGIFGDYDFAPISTCIGKRRLFLNISQEGKDDLEDLVEMRCASALKVSVNEHQSITSFRVNEEKGENLLNEITEEEKEQINNLVYNNKELLQVSFDELDGKFIIHNKDGTYTYESTITNIEDVSYVSSPYIPPSLRNGGRELKSYENEAFSCKKSTIKDDEMDIAITLDGCKVLVGEWIPFGPNQIITLNDKLGSLERIQGGFFTTSKSQPNFTTYDVDAPNTEVELLDFNYTKYLNFEAHVLIPEEGVVQNENLGVHVHKEGTIIFGCKIEALMDKVKNGLPVDYISRLLVDVNIDGSNIINSLSTYYTIKLLNTIYNGDSMNRAKFNLIIAEKITPKKKAREYCDKEAYENELRQVLGDIHYACDLDEDTIFLAGSNGALIAGTNCEGYEPYLVSLLRLEAVELTVHQFFGSTYILNDCFSEIRSHIESHEKDPNSISTIRNLLNECSSKVALIQEVHKRLLFTLNTMIMTIDDSEWCEHITKTFNLEEMQQELMERVNDLNDKMHQFDTELGELRAMADVISESQAFKLQEIVGSNTKNLEDMFRSNERTSSSLEIMNVIMSGTLAFELLDQCIGGWSALDTEWGKKMFSGLLEIPGGWFLLNCLLWGVIAYVLVIFMRTLETKNAFNTYLSKKTIGEEDVDLDPKSQVRKVAWDEDDEVKWNGCPPHLEVSYDQMNHFLLTVFFQVNKNNTTVKEEKLKEIFLKDLEDNHVFYKKIEHRKALISMASASEMGLN